MIRLKVGQVVFLLDLKTRNVVPGRVITENKQKTLKGTLTTYEVHVLKSSDAVATVTIDESNKDQVFDSAKKIRDHLLTQATKSIDALVTRAEKLAADKFKDAEPPVEDVDEDEPAPATAFKPPGPLNPRPSAPGTTQVQLADGTIANVRFSEPRDG